MVFSKAYLHGNSLVDVEQFMVVNSKTSTGTLAQWAKGAVHTKMHALDFFVL
jgi:hypothetical protein